MVDRELNLIYSFFSKCESDLKAIISIINILSKNNYDVSRFEVEIQEIKGKLLIIEKKLIENRNKSPSNIELSSEKYILEKCHESLQSLKGSIINFKEIKMNYDHLKTEQVAQYVDCDSISFEDILNDKFSQLKIGKIDHSQVHSVDLDSELRVDGKCSETKNGGIKRGNNIDHSIETATSMNNQVNSRVGAFQHLNTDVLDSSFKNKLEVQDSISKHIKYTPRMVWHNPRSDFPSSPLKRFTNPSFFDKLTLDTLFFIFYFQQGTLQQFLSIQELKRKKWQFHKKCFAWFYKRSEPKIATEDAEVADYIYFDFEKDWCQKVKNDFTFEFIHLDNTPIVVNKNVTESTSYYNSRSHTKKNQIVLNSDITRDLINADSMMGDEML
ncbi:putative regena domain-containing protein [Cryptosporidium canis]|uniref:Regena domain-containing protein n=1 Tax=Cryptosporidium canis TaxID=195482 RepID=A0ABQ8P7D8_9CRYT|nr:putative regena domain-containing protein [Cryptosporidium canis]KAJ1613655.1 putative regena domain-containing protein [Cryptosporidium canis]